MSILKGKVVSIAGEKTIGVAFSRSYKHKKYKKIIKTVKKYLVHDEKKEYQIDDIVQFKYFKRFSKMKSFIAISKTI